MKTITIQIDDEDHEKLARLADVIDMSVEEFIAQYGVYWITTGMEGSVGDNLAASTIYDTLEEAQRAASKADVADGRKYNWHYYKRPDERISPECSPHFHADRLKEGCVLLEEEEAA